MDMLKCNNLIFRLVIAFSCVLSAISIAYAGDEKPLTELKQKIRAEYPIVSQVDIDELRAWMENDEEEVILLDVREIEEFNVSHLKNALLTTSISDALRNLDGIDKDRLIVAYCSVGYRSSELVKELIKRGYSNVHNLEGSIFEWANNGFPLYRDNEPVNVVHPYGLWWGRYLHRELWAWE